MNVRPLAAEEFYVFVPYVALHSVIDFGISAYLVALLLKISVVRSKKGTLGTSNI